jgi:hypothetical protein
VSARSALAGAFLLTLPLVSPRLRGADEIEHFVYLRSLLFDGDLDFGNEYAHFVAADPVGLAGFAATFLERREPATGRFLNFAPVGAALLWSPFYLLAHAGVLAARALGAGVAADGYSAPYQAAVAYASALYGWLGLLLVHHLLARRADVGEPAAGLAVAALWLATPVLYYTTVAPGFAHACSLLSVGALLALWFRARERDSALDWALAGAAGGLAGLVREQDLFFLVVPAADLAWRLLGRGGARAALTRGGLLAAAALLAFLPQLLAYRALNGRFGPTTLVARKMTWSSPHLLEVLFDPGHGLYLWAPLLLLATLGLAPAAARARRATLLLALGLAVQAWINGSVESWHLAGAFGARRFVSATPVFAWGLAALLAAALPRLGLRATALALACFAWWNVSLMVQFGLRLMDRQRLAWPQVALNQVREVPRVLGRTAWLYLTDRERLVREAR